MVPTDEREARLWFRPRPAGATPSRIRAAFEVSGNPGAFGVQSGRDRLRGFQASLKQAERVRDGWPVARPGSQVMFCQMSRQSVLADVYRNCVSDAGVT